MDFTHLHVHSETGSLLDSAIRIPDLAKRVKELGMSSIALTDHGTLNGSLEFYRECKSAGVKSILGCECYCTRDPDNTTEEKHRDNYHLILLAKNNTGWENLLWLISNAHINNFYYKPRIFFDNFIGRTEGLIASSACLASVFSREGGWDGEKYSDPTGIVDDAIVMFKKLFPDNFYMEIMDNPFPQQTAYNQFILEKAAKHNLNPIITTDAHFLTKEDFATHELLMAMQLKKTLADYRSDSEMTYGPWFYIRSPEEMLEAAKRVGCEQAFHNTIKIAEQCNVNIELGKYKLPVFDITQDPDYEEYKKAAKESLSDS